MHVVNTGKLETRLSDRLDDLKGKPALSIEVKGKVKLILVEAMNE
jgi:hypothetical protein